MNNQLIPVQEINALEIFTKDGLDPLLLAIEKEVATFVPSVETAADRKEIASMAYKVSQSKTYIDAAGKSLVDDIKKQAKVIDTARKKSRDRLDELRDQVRKPLNDWEAEEARKKKEEEERIRKEEERDPQRRRTAEAGRA